MFFFVCRASCKTYFSMRIFFSSRGSIRFSASCNSASKNKVSFLCKFCLSAEHFHNPSFSRKPPRSFGLFSLCSIASFRPRLMFVIPSYSISSMENNSGATQLTYMVGALGTHSSDLNTGFEP